MWNTHVAFHSEEIGLGETLREVCPECKDPKRTLSMTRTGEGAVLYQCFKASCPVKGVLDGGDAIPLDRPTAPPPKKRATWEGVPKPLPEPVREWIQHTWGLEAPPDWAYTDDHGGRIVMPILSPSGARRGWLLRSDGRAQPKALTYVNDGEQGLSWYKTNPHAPTLLVEDVPSAVRSARYVNSVALLGTEIGHLRAQEIADHATVPIVIALDQDATAKSFKHARKWALMWGTVRVLPLKQDLKNMNEADLCKILAPLTRD